MLGPGVWIGSWRIVLIGGIRAAGAHHTAVALVDGGGVPTVYELLGWTDFAHSDVTPRSHPYYGGWTSYRWWRIADVSAIPRVQTAIAVARGEFIGRYYWLADSNRFVSDVLSHAGLNVSIQQQAEMGWTPGWGMHHPRLL